MSESKTIGAGLYLGMILGGLYGLPFGVIGILILGLIGAIIGDEVERFKVKRKRKLKKGGE